MNGFNYRELYRHDPVYHKLFKAFGDENPGCAPPPFCIRCKDDSAWRSLFEREGIEYTELDAPNITCRDLKGISRAPYSMPTAFEPDWLKDAKRTRVLVLNNLELVPYETDDVLEQPSKYYMCEDLYLEHRPAKVEFEFLLHRPDELPRKLSLFSEISVPDNVFTILIVKNAKEISSFVLWKCSIDIDL